MKLFALVSNMSIFNKALDATIIKSFDRSGFERHARLFKPCSFSEELKGKRILITGANKGIGYAAAYAFGKHGAFVHLLCRNEGRGQKAIQELSLALPDATFELTTIDMSSLASIRSAVGELKHLNIDVLIHNAGVLPVEYWESPEGFEGATATNLIGPYLLTKLLIPSLNSEARIIWVSSGGMYGVKLSLSELQKSPRPYDGVRAYAQTKRAEVTLCRWMAHSHPQFNHYSMHPGWVNTEGVVQSLPRFYRWTKSILRTIEQGADTIVWLAAAAPHPTPNGSFWLDRQVQKEHLFPMTSQSKTEEQEFLQWLEDAIKR